MNSFVTIYEFDAKTGVTDQDMRACEPALDRFLKAQPGFMYRSLIKKASGQWIDLYYWRDEASAEAISQPFMESEAGQSFLALIDLPSTTMTKSIVLSESIGPECG
jgi:hypothetical protein